MEDKIYTKEDMNDFIRDFSTTLYNSDNGYEIALSPFTNWNGLAWPSVLNGFSGLAHWNGF